MLKRIPYEKCFTTVNKEKQKKHISSEINISRSISFDLRRKQTKY